MELATLREQFASEIARKAAVADPRVIEAFGRVQRERFVGPGPWCISESGETSPSSDPAYVYQDIVLALSQSQGITNGLPSLHARCIAAVAPKAGERVVQIGAGSGYYTAILADLIGPEGRVIAYEIDPALADKAAENLAPWSSVTVNNRNAVTCEIGPADVVYVNAGASSLPGHWLDALDVGGRLLLPLVPGDAEGAMLLVTRRHHSYAARFIAPARFYPCIGAQDEGDELRSAFSRGQLESVKSLRRDEPVDESCWYSGSDWWLSSVIPAG